MKASVSIQQVLGQRLKHPANARAYLNAVLAEGDPRATRLALHDIISANP